jgi:succinoglycan biosynthesis protein ExoL
VLRCVRSLEILRRTAEALPDKVGIHLRGQASETDIPLRELQHVAASHPNIVFGGPFRNPHDLGDIYGQIHFAWAIDFIAPQSNSKWSLLNRIYEGGLFGAVALASQDTATGRMTERTGFGWTLPEPLETTVPDFLARLTPATYEAMRARVAQAQPSMFVDKTDTRDLLRALEALTKTKLNQRNSSDVIMEPQP